jgi:hypothetical protein
MKALNIKLVIAAVGLAMLATPAFAQRPQRHMHYPTQLQSQDPAGTYPNPVTRSGSAESVESGAAFNTGY